VRRLEFGFSSCGLLELSKFYGPMTPYPTSINKAQLTVTVNSNTKSNSNRIKRGPMKT